MKHILIFSLLLISVQNCFAKDSSLTTAYSFKPRHVKNSLLNSKFGEYTLEMLMADDFMSKFDDIYGVTDGWTKGTHMSGNKWTKYYRAGYNNILSELGNYGYKFTLETAFDVCAKNFRSYKDSLARNINHAQGCRNFISKLSETNTKEYQSRSDTICNELLKSYRGITTQTNGVIDKFRRFGSSKTYYCGGHCKRIGDDTIYILDEEFNVINTQKVDDFCDGESSGGQDYWYKSKNNNDLEKITNTTAIELLNSKI